MDKFSDCFQIRQGREFEVTPIELHSNNGIDTGIWHSANPASLGFKTRLQPFEKWIAPKLISRLDSHFESCALVVVIVMHSSTQEQAICEVLLRRAVDHIYVQDAPESHS